MRIVGDWFVCPDGVVRPAVAGDLTDAAGQPVRERFLIDTGADRTVLTAEAAAALGLPAQPVTGWALSGVGGSQAFAQLTTTLTLTAEDGSPARIQAPFAAFTDPATADMCILGRDVLDLFDLIVSRPRQEVLLLATNHQYRVERV